MYHVKTRNGLFANQGYGGGVFNGNTAFGAYNHADYAQGISGLIGVGALPANKPIPGACWSQPGFKDCHAVAWGEAKSKCDYCKENPYDTNLCGGFTTIEDCIERSTNRMVWDNCMSLYCRQQDPSVTYDVGFTEYKKGDPCSSANTIKNVQYKSGTKADGKWGPNSQSAYDTMVRVQGTTYCELVPGCSGQTPMGGNCDGVTVPAPTTTTPPPPPPVIEPEIDVEEPEPKTQHASMLWIGGIAALAIGAAMVAGGKKKRR